MKSPWNRPNSKLLILQGLTIPSKLKIGIIFNTFCAVSEFFFFFFENAVAVSNQSLPSKTFVQPKTEIHLTSS